MSYTVNTCGTFYGLRILWISALPKIPLWLQTNIELSILRTKRRAFTHIILIYFKFNIIAVDRDHHPNTRPLLGTVEKNNPKLRNVHARLKVMESNVLITSVEICLLAFVCLAVRGDLWVGSWDCCDTLWMLIEAYVILSGSNYLEPAVWIHCVWRVYLWFLRWEKFLYIFYI